MALLLVLAVFAWAAPLETKAEKDARMKWWKEARFGLFLHWGLYAVPSGEWNGHTNYAEWIMEEAHIPVSTYEHFEQQFDPVKFDADKWVTMAKNAGMKYICITTKHHEGFNMFDSKYSNYKITNTPFKRDVMKELAAACKKHGLKMCWYHSIMDWHHPDYLPRRGWEDRPAAGADMDRYVEYLRNEVSQLLTDYGPIGVMWFDGEWESTWNHKYGQALYDLCRKLQPNVIVNNRVDVGRSGMAGMSTSEGTAGDFGTPEQEIPAQGIPGSYWETCMTMNDHWGYNKNDHDYKSSKDLIQKLVDIASKGGNFLLNIGPTPEGEFPPLAQERLKDLGAWTKVNGDAIYATDASPFPSLSWGRCTQKAKGNHTMLYLDVFDWPTNGKLVVPGIGNKPVRASLLAGHKSLSVSRQDTDLVIDVPSAAPDENCSVVALEVEGKPVVYQSPAIEAATTMVVQSIPVTLDSKAEGVEVRYTLDGSDPTASSTLYTGPLQIDRSETLKARSFADGRAVSQVVSQEFTTTTPQAATEVADPKPGVSFKMYAGDWDALPDFSSLTPQESGTMSGVDISKWPSKEHFGIVATGYVNAPTDAVYQFQLSSDDGSKLVLDGKTLIDHDGTHSLTAKAASIALAKGFHSIEVQYFNKTGGLGLELAWCRAGGKLAQVGTGELFHRED